MTIQACTLISWGCVHLRWCGSLEDYTLCFPLFCHQSDDDNNRGSFTPSSSLHFLTVSTISPCLRDTFPKCGDYALLIGSHKARPEPHPQKGPPPKDSEVLRLYPLHQRTAEHARQLNIWAERWGAGPRGEDMKQSVWGLKDTHYLVLSRILNM